MKNLDQIMDNIDIFRLFFDLKCKVSTEYGQKNRAQALKNSRNTLDKHSKIFQINIQKILMNALKMILMNALKMFRMNA